MNGAIMRAFRALANSCSRIAVVGDAIGRCFTLGRAGQSGKAFPELAYSCSAFASI